MAIGAYIGKNNGSQSVANTVKNIYLGVNNKAQKVIKAYVGDANGKAQLWWGGREEPSIIGSFWFYYETINNPTLMQFTETFTDGTVSSVWNSVISKTNKGIAFYLIAKNDIESWVLTLSTDSNAIPYTFTTSNNYGLGTQTNSIIINKETWYYTYILRRFITISNLTPNCVLTESSFNNKTISQIVTQIINNRIYTDDFAEDYQVFQTYNLNIGDKERTLRKAIAIFLFKNVTYSSYNSYQQACIHIEDIVNFILTNTASYNVIGVNCSYDKDVNRVEVSAGGINMSPPTNVEIWTKNKRNGYTLLTNNISSPYTANSYVRCWFNNNESYMRTQIVQQGYNVSKVLGVEIRNYSNQNHVNLTNIGLKFA